MASMLFDEDFLWGASSSGHQVEGGNYDQWTVWELEHAAELAKTAPDRLKWLPDWEDIKAEASNPDNYIVGKGVDHYHKYRSDFDILHTLGLNAFRFSIEWSRLEPQEGAWDEHEIDHYHNYITELKKRGVEPVLNLWHWTHPVWFEERGAFGRHENLTYWMRFVQKIADEFGDDVRYVITINEPNIYVTYPEWNGGVAVPPHASRPARLLMFLRLIKAHKIAYRILKAKNKDLMISAAVQMADNRPRNKSSSFDKFAARVADSIGNYFYYNRTRRYLDFIGFNYYFTNYLNGAKVNNPDKPKNNLGWYMEPGGVGEVATKLWLKYRKPVMITENGVADGGDEYRQWWLKETMLSLIKARRSGVNLIGYMHWSLLDNFEWAYGWWPKFGLVAVDREHGMKRTVRPSAKWWAAQLKKLKDLQ